MIKKICAMLFYTIMVTTVCAQSEQEVAATDSLVSIITSDGSEIVGYLILETEDKYSLKTPAGIEMDIPKSAVVRFSGFEGKIVEDKLFRPDPNKSMYLFSPSAFPIGKGGRYCRDFCVFFPSYNFGASDLFSIQLGFVWVPGVDIDQIPIVASGKYTLTQKEKTTLAAGIMYVRIPVEEGFGAGFTFITGTYGDRYNHISLSLGWGFVEIESDWEFMDRPIIVLAGNKRISNKFALVGEGWFIPELDAEYTPLMFAVRFIGNAFAVDVGALFSLDSLSEAVPAPILNFTYHFKD
jgi:hypothetical protein